jgi:hypothetical protein
MLKIHRAENGRILTGHRTPVSAKYIPKIFKTPHIWCFHLELSVSAKDMDIAS